MILPFIPIIDPVLMTNSAIAIDGGFFVTIDINCVRAKTPPQTTRYHIELRDITFPFSTYTWVDLDQTIPINRPANPIAINSNMDGRYFTKNEKTVRDIKLMRIARINEGIETFFGLRKVKTRSTTENTKTIRKMMLIVFIIRGIIAAISIPFNYHIVQ
jgi:hypothetical protein